MSNVMVQIEDIDAAIEQQLADNDLLNEKQRRFVAEYLVDTNGAAAARRMGFSDDNARFRARDYMAKPHVIDAIRTAVLARARRYEASDDRIVNGFADIAFAEPARPMETDKGNTIMVGTEDRDRLKALENLAKINQMYVEKKEIALGGAGGGPVQVVIVPAKSALGDEHGNPIIVAVDE